MWKRIAILCCIAVVGNNFAHAGATCTAVEQTDTGKETTLRVMAYNVENLFDCEHDSLKNDYDFLPEGANHWTPNKYRAKLHHIAQVIAAIGGADGENEKIRCGEIIEIKEGEDEYVCPAIVGLVEVENDRCLNDLQRHLPRTRFPYAAIHFESPDQRGVDVALLYDSTRLDLLHAHPIPVSLPETDRPTRDILYASFSHHLHIFVCHLPSQLGGANATQHKRDIAFATLQQAVDSILRIDSAAIIVAMGDFNTAPANRLQSLHNLMLSDSKHKHPHVMHPKHIDGTHQWQGQWSYLDQFFVSAPIRHIMAHVFTPDWLLVSDDKYMGYKPFRTYSGPRYIDGYSDHLPIYIDLPAYE